MVQKLSMLWRKKTDDCDYYLPHVEATYLNSVRAAAGLALSELNLGRLPLLRLTIFDGDTSVRGHRRLDRDQLAYVDLARDHQQRAYALVREEHESTTACTARIIICEFT